MDKNEDACEQPARSMGHVIRPSCSALVRAPSWSLGFGADSRNSADDSLGFEDQDEEEHQADSSEHESDESQRGIACGRASIKQSGSKPSRRPSDLKMEVSRSLPSSSSVLRNLRKFCQAQLGSNQTNQLTSAQVRPSDQANQLADPTFEPIEMPKVEIEIPTVYLNRKQSATSPVSSGQSNGPQSTSSSFHVYQLNIKTSTRVEWSVYRRYSQFLSLHKQLKSREPELSKFSFPPKQRLNNKASTIVQDRRRRLEDYMRNLYEIISRNFNSYQRVPGSQADSEPSLDGAPRPPDCCQQLVNLLTLGPRRVFPSLGCSAELDQRPTSNSGGGADNETSGGRGDDNLSLAMDQINLCSSPSDGAEEQRDSVSSRMATTTRSISLSGDIETTSERALEDNFDCELEIIDTKNRGANIIQLFYNFISPNSKLNTEFELSII